jgi:hypothetical protein
MGEHTVAPRSTGPRNLREYDSWLKELALQLDEMLRFGDELVEEGVLTEEGQEREELERIVIELYALLQKKGHEVQQKYKRI